MFVSILPGTLCGWREFTSGKGARCKGDHGAPAPAVHVLTESLPVANAGTPLCAFHSPFDVVKPTPAVDVIPDGSQVTITIGRNIGANPMGDGCWEMFQDDVRTRAYDYLNVDMAFGPFLGRGTWTDENGVIVHEDSAVLTFVIGTDETDDRSMTTPVHVFTCALSRLAEHYGQDAIAWSYGPGILATR